MMIIQSHFKFIAKEIAGITTLEDNSIPIFKSKTELDQTYLEGLRLEIHVIYSIP